MTPPHVSRFARPRLLRVVASAVAIIACVRGGFAVAGTASGDDPFLWLEQVHGARATAWVAKENAKTLAVLTTDPHFVPNLAKALAIATAPDRVAYPGFAGDRVTNFWQDTTHVRGLWRETTLPEYAADGGRPAWKPLLDVDALATAEHRNWVWGGADCESPGATTCLVSLSDGGEDAMTIREFDPRTKRFVERDRGAFVFPTAKQDVAWESDDSLLVARAWTPDEATHSGYAYVVKRVRRGVPLDRAVEIYRGEPSDVEVYPMFLRDAAGDSLNVVVRAVTAFESEYRLVTPTGTEAIALPRKCEVVGLLDGRLLVRLQEAWTVEGSTFVNGSLVAIDLAALRRDPSRPRVTLVDAPGPRTSISGVASTRDHVVVTSYDNVRGRADVYTPGAGASWTHRRLDLPDDSSIGIEAASTRRHDALLTVTGFLTPTTLVRVDPDDGAMQTIARAPARFDASRDVVEQHEAISRDGTRIPYFVVHRNDVAYDGSTPTILSAYGGFEISETPSYSGNIGALWLERGGAYVLANIRGGGEFGPAWHEAGLKTHRQRIYDDFAAVGRALIASKLTSPRHLGIKGGSNGGLLMGVELEQHPDLWNAVDIEIPLLDMLRYEKIAAGSYWVGEYGSVAVPAERAFLARISPYQNLRRGVHYPMPFIWTTTKDDRVGPQHARKFAAKLASLGDPYLFYEVTEGGHGGGANLQESSYTTALVNTYFDRQLFP